METVKHNFLTVWNQFTADAKEHKPCEQISIQLKKGLSRLSEEGKLTKEKTLNLMKEKLKEMKTTDLEGCYKLSGIVEINLALGLAMNEEECSSFKAAHRIFKKCVNGKLDEIHKEQACVRRVPAHRNIHGFMQDLSNSLQNLSIRTGESGELIALNNFEGDEEITRHLLAKREEIRARIESKIESRRKIMELAEREKQNG